MAETENNKSIKYSLEDVAKCLLRVSSKEIFKM